MLRKKIQIIQLLKKELHTQQMGGNFMKYKNLLLLFFFCISIIYSAKNDIVIYYGTSRPNSVKYNFMDLTKNKIEITKNMMKVTDKDDPSDIIAEIPMKEGEYKKLEKIIKKVINKSEGEYCGDAWQIPDLIKDIETKEEITKIHLKILLQGKEYCMIERNELTKYLEEKYKLDLEW